MIEPGPVLDATGPVERYVRHVERFGADGVLDVAAQDLGEAEYAELVCRLARTPGAAAIRCATPGCLVVFAPARKGQRYHDAACRQKAKRIAAGASTRFVAAEDVCATRTSRRPIRGTNRPANKRDSRSKMRAAE